MRDLKLNLLQRVIAASIIFLVCAAIALIEPLRSGNSHHILANLSYALIAAVFLTMIGWFILDGSSRIKVFGLFFILVSLLIMTVPLRARSHQIDTELRLQGIQAVLTQVGENDTIGPAGVITITAEELGFTERRAERLLDGISRLYGLDTIEYQTLLRTQGDLEEELERITIFAPEAQSTIRYGDVREEAPASTVQTRTWLIFVGLSFFLGGLLALSLPEKLNEWLQLGLIAGALLLLTPLIVSVLSAMIEILKRGTGAIPPALWWVLGLLAFAASVGAIAYSKRQDENAVGGTWQIVNGVLLLPTVLIVAGVGKQTNVLTMFAESLRLATPVVIGAISGLWSERSGVVNIAIEGMMLAGACFGFTTYFYLGDMMPSNQALFISVIVSIITGGVMAMLHAWMSITFKTDQIVSGTVINILAVGLTSFVRRQWLLSTDAGRVTLPSIAIPGLSKIPLIGPVLFNNKPIFYSMFVLLIVTYYVIFHTSWGLRIRAVGEHPHAADTVGINVFRTRYIAVLISGLIAGLGGAWFSLETVGGFDDSMTSGRGFIALAAMIFGKWKPFGSFFGGLLFGFADALGTRFQILEVPVPPQFLQILPYLTTMIVLAGLIGRAIPPAADGTPYEK
jgi:ABC-type uncharacterized transport system permease subunit